jgi:hypothetical protein
MPITRSQLVWLDHAAKNPSGLYCAGPLLTTARALARKGLSRLVERNEMGLLYEITRRGKAEWNALTSRPGWFHGSLAFVKEPEYGLGYMQKRGAS